MDEAADQLGINKDRLTQLREAGKVRAYRDGASWKFRNDDIERLASEGIPTIDPPSDIDLGSNLSLDLDDDKTAEPSGLELDLGDDELVTGPASDLKLDDLEEPTDEAEAGDSEEVLGGGDDELLDLSDSILLSEKDIGGPAGRPPSTIIGRSELDPDGDLDLTLRPEDSTTMSDVKLAKSDVLIGADDESLDLEPPNPSDHFQDLAELDIDLESESSRVLTPGPTKGKPGAKAQAAPPPSDLELAASDSSNVVSGKSDIALSGSGAASGGLTGLSALGLDDDQVLGEGSDITLSAASSGINIISPSDSGLSLDEVALSSASVSSPLDLGDDVGLEPLELSEDADEGEEPFQLTPLGEGEDEEKDSSQVIALEEFGEEEGVVFQADEREAAAVGEDFSPAGLAAGAPVAVAPAEDVAMSGPVFALLTCGVVMLMVCGMMMYDLVRNIWSWDDVSPLNSTLIEVVNPLL
jgi:excisionase family DNA binding protein